MAIEVRHTCLIDENDYLTVQSIPEKGHVEVNGFHQNECISFTFDISTAIRLSKSIRTEINKAKSEVKDV